jgi:hypothetical protein
MAGPLETPPDDAMVIEVDRVTEANLADVRVQDADEASIWIQSFSDLSHPYSEDVLFLPSQALHDVIASASEIYTDPLPSGSAVLTSRFLADFGILPGST